MVVTAVDVLTKYWPFGQSSFLLCRTVKESQSCKRSPRWIILYVIFDLRFKILVDLGWFIVISCNSGIVKAAPCFAVYLASLTIVVIALDRYRCIVHSTKSQLSNKQVS